MQHIMQVLNSWVNPYNMCLLKAQTISLKFICIYNMYLKIMEMQSASTDGLQREPQEATTAIDDPKNLLLDQVPSKPKVPPNPKVKKPEKCLVRVSYHNDMSDLM